MIISILSCFSWALVSSHRVSMLSIAVVYFITVVSLVFSVEVPPVTHRKPLSLSQFSSLDIKNEFEGLREKEPFGFSPPDFTSLRLRKASSSRRNDGNLKEEEIAPIGWLYERFYEDVKCKKRALAQTGTRAGVCITNPQPTTTNATPTSYMIVCSESKKLSVAAVSFISPCF
jgi:hypothetical protein